MKSKFVFAISGKTAQKSQAGSYSFDKSVEDRPLNHTCLLHISLFAGSDT